jgi:hypothetical protein
MSKESEMRAMLLGAAAALAAIAMPTGPAQAKEPFVGFPNANASPPAFGGGGFQIGAGFDDRRFDRRRRHGDGNLGIWVNGGEWAHYNNRSFQSDSYNDWWHDQPWRSQPAWVRNNQGCRAYWSGGGWRC